MVPRSEPAAAGTVALRVIGADDGGRIGVRRYGGCGQPAPVRYKVDHLGGTGGSAAWTVIGRQWAPGDVPRCRLCPADRCNADGGWCVVSVPGFVADVDCPLYRWPER